MDDMNKSTDYLGQPIFGQVLSLLSRSSVRDVIVSHQANRYYKKLHLWEHLVSMLYCVFSGCTSLREVQVGLEVCQGKLSHLSLSYVPPRSTLSDGNKKRPAKVFGSIYEKLYSFYKNPMSDSGLDPKILKRLFIADSSTISLFKAVLKAAGKKPGNGKSKGGIKVNTLLNAEMNMPVVVNFMAAAMNDRQFLKHIQDLPRYSIIVFDKGYESFSYFHDFTQNDIYFVTRQKETAAYTSIEEFDIDQQPDTILKDERIEVIYKVKIGGNIPLQLRRVAFWDESTKRTFVFITNNFELTSIQVADIYKNRWQIESFLKKLKQNFPHVYFLGDNANAIEIQIWCALIALLLLQVIHYGNKSKMAFSLLASLVRQHLMNYVSFASIIANYNRKRPRPKPQNKPKGKPPDLFTPILF